jgi:hypothetical protein
VALRRDFLRARSDHHQQLLLARLAVQVRCYQLEVGEPDLDGPRLVHRIERGEATEIFLRGSELSAKVVLPRPTHASR